MPIDADGSAANASTGAPVSISLESFAASGAGEPAVGPEGWRREVVFWAFHAGYWLVIWAAGRLLVDIVLPGLEDPGRFVAGWTATGFVTTAVVRWIARRDDLRIRLGLSKVGIVMGAAMIAAIGLTLAQDWIVRLPAEAAVSGPRWTIAMFVIRFAMLGGWGLVYLGGLLLADHNTAQLRAARAEAAANLNELRFRQSQMNPHFLFNALNTVMAVKDDPQAVEGVTQALAEYLRFVLHETGPLEPLGRELDALEPYLTVQGVRFGDDLVCRIDCDLAARRVLVPPMMIQPLVENAFKYGAKTSPPPLRVAVTARLHDGMLVVEVVNSGAWVPPGSGDSTQVGFRSLMRRLEMLYGGAAFARVTAAAGEVRVTLRLPVAPRPLSP